MADEAGRIADLQTGAWARAGLAGHLPGPAAMTARWLSAITAPPLASCRVLVSTTPDRRTLTGFAAIGPSEDPDAGPADAVELAWRVLTEMITIIRTGQGLTGEAVERIVAMESDDPRVHPSAVLTQNILSNRGRTIRPKTLNQKRYVDAIDTHTVSYTPTRSPSASAPPAPARPTWPWRRPSRRCSPSRSTASS